MDYPHNLMMIVGVDDVRGELHASDLKRVIERAGWDTAVPPKAVVDPSGAWWVEDEALDIDWHLRESTSRARGKRELKALVSKLASTSLDFDRPLWQFHVVRNYAGGSALIMRVHHCYADGIALVR